MASEKKKRTGAKVAAKPERQDKKVAEAGAPERATAAPADEGDDEPIRWDEIPGLEAPGEPDPQEVEATANKVLDNVLRRFGWARDERGRIEHVGEDEDDGRRGLKKAS